MGEAFGLDAIAEPNPMGCALQPATVVSHA